MVCEGRQECSDGGADGTGGGSRFEFELFIGVLFISDLY